MTLSGLMTDWGFITFIPGFLSQTNFTAKLQPEKAFVNI